MQYFRISSRGGSILITVILKWGGLLPETDVELIFILIFVYTLSLLGYW